MTFEDENLVMTSFGKFMYADSKTQVFVRIEIFIALCIEL